MLDYRYLLLDADGTFLDFSSTERIALNVLFEKLNLSPSPELVSSYHRANSLCWQRLEEGNLSMKDLEEERFSLFFESEGIDRDSYTASEIYIEELAKAAFYMEGAEEMLSRLSEAYSLVVVTNGIARVQRGRLERLGAMRFFADLVISGEIGVAKPSPEFFSITLERIGAEKKDCLVIGDSLTSDMKGACDSGIDSLYLNLGGKEVPEELKVSYQAHSYDELLSILL